MSQEDQLIEDYCQAIEAARRYSGHRAVTHGIDTSHPACIALSARIDEINRLRDILEQNHIAAARLRRIRHQRLGAPRTKREN